VAIRTAHDVPDLVDGLVVVNSIGGSAWTSRGEIVRSVAERPLWDWGLHLWRDLLPVRQLTRVVPVVASDVISNLLRNPMALLRVGRIAARADLSAELVELQRRGVPVVVVWGGEPVSCRVSRFSPSRSVWAGSASPCGAAICGSSRSRSASRR
jgi:pimeloyl-ACP methyl ester carboxylesterase